MPSIRILVALGILSAAGCIAGSAANADPKTGRVEGVVVDASRQGIRGAAVAVLAPGSPPTQLGAATTGPGGKFTLDRVPPVKGLTVHVSKSTNFLNLAGQKQRVTVNPGKTTNVGQIELKASSR
jgi:hypothetical protein